MIFLLLRLTRMAGEVEAMVYEFTRGSAFLGTYAAGEVTWLSQPRLKSV
jgi:hypothetical protein